MGEDDYPSTMTEQAPVVFDPDAHKYRKPNRHERRRIESLTAQWNKQKHLGKMLHEVLGMKLEEYARYVTHGEVPLTF